MILVSESTLQIDKERIDELNIKIIEYPLFVNGVPYDVSYSMSSEEKEKLRLLIKDKNNKVTTAGLNYSDIKKIYTKYSGEQIVSMHQSFNNSKATAEALTALQKELSGVQQIYLFDTYKIAAAQSIQVLEAAKAVRDGIPFDELKKLLEKNRANTGHFGVLSDLFFLRRSGRIGYTKALIGSAMKVLPLIKDDEESGALKSIGKAKNYRQANQKFIDIMQDELNRKKSRRISILAAYCGEHRKDCDHLKKLVEEQDWDSEVEIHYSGHSDIPHEGPEFYEVGYIIK